VSTVGEPRQQVHHQHVRHRRPARDADRGWVDVQEVTTANEKVAFALPRELRKALKESVR
jgi:hypothetical protein